VRTTITLDPDVARQLEKEMRRSGKGLKAAVNDALRRAFQAPGHPSDLPKFVVKPHAFGLRPGIDPDRLNQLVDELDVAETVRKARR
jgi:hypothetical protein